MSQMPAAEEAEAADTNDALLSFSDPEKVALGILKRGSAATKPGRQLSQ